MSEVTVAQLEEQMEFCKHLQANKEMAERLAHNHDFRKLVLEGFCRDDCARYVQESGDPFLNNDQRADALHMAQAAGHLKRYLSLQIQMGGTAARNLADLEEAINEARAEEGDL
jgi:hypothetical protein